MAEDGSNFQSGNILTAPQLVALRKGEEEVPQAPVIGEKFCTNGETLLEQKAVETALESHLTLLEQKRIARRCDLMEAEWNEELKVSLTSKIKGKFVQHMGQRVGDKIALTPEESLFLLENGSIEIYNGKMPMSTEEAHAVMLKRNLAAERYQVYSYLSQLGFIVVPHRTLSSVTRNEKVKNSDKRQVKKKRKCLPDPLQEPHSKRLTFAGALNCDPDINVLSDTSEDQDVSKSSVALNPTENGSCVHDLPITPEPENDNACDSEINVDEMSNGVNVLSEQDELSKPDVSNILKTSSEAAFKCINQSQELGTITLENQNGISPESIPVTTQSDEVEDSTHLEVSLPQQSPEVQLESVVAEILLKTIEADYMEVDSQSTVVSANGSEKTQDVFEAESSNNSNDALTDSQCAIVESAEDENVDVENNSDIMSCSAESDYNLSASEESNSKDDFVDDDDIMLVEVTKKESTPLAVIDLLSDEDKEDENKSGSEEESDDDIKVVKCISAPSTSSAPSPKKLTMIKIPRFHNWKTEEGTSEEVNPKLEHYRLTLHLPELFRKDVVCLARPAANFLPAKVRLCKEAYILDLSKGRNTQSDAQPPRSRMWNSFRDMQDYQRNRRLNRGAAFPRFQNQRWQDRDQPPSSNNGYDGPSGGNSGFNNYNSYNSPREFYPAQQLHGNSTAINSTMSIREDGHSNFNIGMPRGPMDFPINSMVNSVAMSVRPALANLPLAQNADVMAEVQRTVYTVTRNMISTMMGGSFMQNNFQSREFMPANNFSHFNEPHSYPQHSGFNNNHFGNQDNWGNNYRPRRAHRTRPFPCRYRNASNKHSWTEILKEVEGEKEESSGSDIEELPKNIAEFLWDNSNICPLVKPGTKHPSNEVLKSLNITRLANLTDKSVRNDKYFPTSVSIEISFDVYLPGYHYKKTSPDTPKYRIIILRSADAMLKYSEIAFLQRDFNDGAILQLAVVDNGDISFYSFNSVRLPVLLAEQKADSISATM